MRTVSRTAAPKLFHTRCRLEYALSAPITSLFNFRAQNPAIQKVASEVFQVTPEWPTKWVVSQPDQNRFDATRLAPINGLGAIGDATDASVCKVFQSAQVVNQSATGEPFQPLTAEDSNTSEVSIAAKLP